MSALDQSPNQGRPPSKPLDFVSQVEALFRRHGFTDWAVVVRQPGVKPSRWLGAGAGIDPIQDREAVGLLHLELAALASDAIILAAKLEKEATRRANGTPPGQN